MEKEKDSQLTAGQGLPAPVCSQKRATPETDAEWRATGVELRKPGTPRRICSEFARKLERERDEAREALMAIEEIYTDGSDTYEDWRAMGELARNFLSANNPLSRNPR